MVHTREWPLKSRDQLIAAPLKRFSLKSPRPEMVSVPRSIDRGPIEASSTRLASTWFCSESRDQLIAAPLKPTNFPDNGQW